jgi:hypothetical protein
LNNTVTKLLKFELPEKNMDHCDEYNGKKYSSGLHELFQVMSTVEKIHDTGSKCTVIARCNGYVIYTV